MTIEINVKIDVNVTDQALCLNASNQLFDTLLDQVGEIKFNSYDRFHEKAILEIACMELMNTEIRIMEKN